VVADPAVTERGDVGVGTEFEKSVGFPHGREGVCMGARQGPSLWDREAVCGPFDRLWIGAAGSGNASSRPDRHYKLGGLLLTG
jgi:hypothetical protein